MNRHAAASARSLSPRLRVLSLPALLCLTAALLYPSRCSAQQEAPPGDAALYTLHTYTNLVQIPTLVLSWRSRPLPPIPRENFTIRLDAGPPFHPTSLHIEGNDPIDLAVLLDASGDQNDLLQHFDAALAALVPAYLLPQDHITVYALDCALVRSDQGLPANALALRSAVANVLHTSSLRGPRGKGCAGGILLRDSLVWIANSLSHLPGRRVLLAVTNGQFDKSTWQWADSKDFLAIRGVALFSIHSIYDPSLTPSQLLSTDPPTSNEQLFRMLCEGTGGLFLSTSATDLPATLSNVIHLLRGRYILEFPRPDDNRNGAHQVDISVPGTHDFIVHTGATVPLADPSTLTDPNTVPTAKSPATYGTRHPITPNH